MDFELMDAPFHINWNITYRCNFKCRHCYSRSRNLADELDTKGKMTVAQNIVKSRVFGINLGGGEPLLSKDTLSIIAFLAANNIKVDLSTNGWNTSNETIKQLKEAGLDAALLSLDNIDAAKHDAFRHKLGSYDSCLKTAASYVAEGITTMFSTVITSENFSVLEDIIELALRTGCQGVDFKRLRFAGNAKNAGELGLSINQEAELYRNIRIWKDNYPIAVNLVYGTKQTPGIDLGCPCGKTSLSIMSNGTITPCVYSSKSIGNALTNQIDVLWQNSEALDYLRQHSSCLGLERQDGNL